MVRVAVADSPDTGSRLTVSGEIERLGPFGDDLAESLTFPEKSVLP